MHGMLAEVVDNHIVWTTIKERHHWCSPLWCRRCRIHRYVAAPWKEWQRCRRITNFLHQMQMQWNSMQQILSQGSPVLRTLRNNVGLATFTILSTWSNIFQKEIKTEKWNITISVKKSFQLAQPKMRLETRALTWSAMVYLSHDMTYGFWVQMLYSSRCIW